MENLFDLQLRSLPTAPTETRVQGMSFSDLCNSRECNSVSGASCYHTCNDTCQSPPTAC
jgi:hypothetical protein